MEVDVQFSCRMGGDADKRNLDVMIRRKAPRNRHGVSGHTSKVPQPMEPEYIVARLLSCSIGYA